MDYRNKIQHKLRRQAAQASKIQPQARTVYAILMQGALSSSPVTIFLSCPSKDVLFRLARNGHRVVVTVAVEKSEEHMHLGRVPGLA